MTDTAASLERLALHLVRAIGPVARSLTPAEALELIGSLGLELPASLATDAEFTAALERARDGATAVAGLADPLAEAIEAEDAVALVTLAGRAVAAVADLANGLEGVATVLRARAATLPGVSEADVLDFAGRLVGAVLGSVVVEYLAQHATRLLRWLTLLGLVDVRVLPPDPADPEADPGWIGRPRLDRLSTWFSAPPEVLEDVYGWGGPTPDLGLLLGRLADLAVSLGIPIEWTAPAAGVPPKLETFLLEWAPSATAPQGLEIALATELSGGADFELPLTPRLALLLGIGLELAAGTAVTLSPPFAVGVTAPSGAVTGEVSAGLRVRPAEGEERLVLGRVDGTRLELTALSVEAMLTLAATSAGASAGEFAVEVTVSEGRLVLDLGSADGFLSAVVGNEPIEQELAGTVRWSPTTGLSLRGGGIERRIPVNRELGPLRIDDLRLGASFVGGGIALAPALSISAKLGPFDLAVGGLGAAVDLTFTPGNLGVASGTLRFKPPTAIGLAINTPAVSGGGFLEVDEAAGRYAGVFELTIIKTVSVKAIAIITTRLPDGRDGFALLIMITAEGFTPIQLGLGFTLTGIGGLLALNRTVDADAVRGGLSDGVLDSVLFAKDPVGNANRILTTLDAIFPLAGGRLVVGPIAEIGWGTPPLVKLRIALLLEVPQPIRAVLLAALAVALPNEKNALVELHVDAIGVLDLGRGELALDASLHHSRLLKFELTGDMALRLNWGSEPTFLLSVGGFHPRFVPPRGLRRLNRLALTLSGSDNPRVRLETYLAVTSSTIQMGARVELYVAIGGFGIEGGGSFDALIQWSPFALDVGFAAWVRVFSPAGTLLAISVSVNITGPAPWHLTGKASIQILFFSIEVPVDVYLGEAAERQPVETVDVAALLWEQVADRNNWQAVLPAGVSAGATLTVAPAAGSTAPLVAHPLAAVSVRQRSVPLGTRITRMGGAVPMGGPRSYDLDVTAPLGLQTSPVEELFAPAQYTELPDDARLTGAAFVPMPAGVSLGAREAASSGPAFGSDLAVETLEVTSLDVPATPGGRVPAVAA
jgi:hypothetical protein